MGTELNNLLILIRGLPGAGKSTMAKKLMNSTSVHLEADMFFEKDGKYEFKPYLLIEAHTWCLHETIKNLKEGKTVIVSNTFTKFWELEPYLEAAQELTGNRFKVISLKTQFKSIHGIPQDAMDRMSARWEDLPYLNELVIKG
jgi:predicted kinase